MIQQPTIDTDVDQPSQTKPSRLKPASQPYLVFLSVSGRVNLNGSQSFILSTRVNGILLFTDPNCKSWNSTILSTLIWSHLFDQLPALFSCEKSHFCLSRCSGIIFQLGINWLVTKNSIFNSLKLCNFIHSNLKSLVRSVASSLLMWKSAFLSVFVSHAPLSESLTSKPVLKSVNLQNNTLVRWANEPNDWSSKRLMIQVFSFS